MQTQAQMEFVNVILGGFSLTVISLLAIHVLWWIGKDLHKALKRRHHTWRASNPRPGRTWRTKGKGDEGCVSRGHVVDARLAGRRWWDKDTPLMGYFNVHRGGPGGGQW